MFMLITLFHCIAMCVCFFLLHYQISFSHFSISWHCQRWPIHLRLLSALNTIACIHSWIKNNGRYKSAPSSGISIVDCAERQCVRNECDRWMQDRQLDGMVCEIGAIEMFPNEVSVRVRALKLPNLEPLQNDGQPFFSLIRRIEWALADCASAH